jgi:hypothetical protein
VGMDGYNSAGDSPFDKYKYHKRKHYRSEDNRPDREWQRFVSSSFFVFLMKFFGKRCFLLKSVFTTLMCITLLKFCGFINQFKNQLVDKNERVTATVFPMEKSSEEVSIACDW